MEGLGVLSREVCVMSREACVLSKEACVLSREACVLSREVEENQVICAKVLLDRL